MRTPMLTSNLHIARFIGSRVTKLTARLSAIRGGENFHENSFDNVIVLVQPWYNVFETLTDKVLFAAFLKMRTFQF